MKHPMPVLKRLLPLLVLLIALFAVAQVYKWVDEKGNVHFGDRPPEEQKKVEKLATPQGPSKKETDTAEERLSEILETRRQREADAKKEEIQQEKTSAHQRELEEQRFNTCVQALQQLTALNVKARAFRLDGNWMRTYLENEDRPGEIDRLYNLVKSNCKTDRDSLEKQNAGAVALGQGLNVKCVSAREKLAKEIDGAKKKKMQDYLDSECPEVDPRGLWIVDWIPRR